MIQKKIQRTIYIEGFFFYCAVYETIWINMVEPVVPHLTKQRNVRKMRFAA